MNKLILLALTLATSLVWARPSTDTAVDKFLGASAANSGRTLPILILYSHDGSAFLTARHPFFYSAFINQRLRYIGHRQAALQAHLGVNSRAEFHPLWIVNGSTAELTADEVRSLLQRPDIRSIRFLNRVIRFKAALPQSYPVDETTFTYGLQKLMVPEVRTQHPLFMGTGIRVGILDTGIDPNHPDLSGKVVAYKNFSPSKNSNPDDGFGHGTHVAGTIAGGTASGKAIGVAPAAQLVIGRIFDSRGDSTLQGILDAMQWMTDPDGDPATADFPRVVNNSWGDDSSFFDHDPADEPLCAAVDTWVQLGIIPIFSAGNSGPRSNTIGVPAACPNAVAIGATDWRDLAPSFSSVGPAKWKTVEFIKPDISAPGLDVFSAYPRGQYETMSGTSMSSPHVSGAVAVLLQAYPALTSDKIVAALYNGSVEVGRPGKDNTFGVGRVDLLHSLELLKSNFAP